MTSDEFTMLSLSIYYFFENSTQFLNYFGHLCEVKLLREMIAVVFDNQSSGGSGRGVSSYRI
jgi:hypothetical protein